MSFPTIRLFIIDENGLIQDPANTPSKGSKKDKKDKRGKKSEKSTVNGDDGDNDRNSPEINTQEQMAAQRASGGAIDAPPPKINVSWDLDSLTSTQRSYVASSVVFNC